MAALGVQGMVLHTGDRDKAVPIYSPKHHVCPMAYYQRYVQWSRARARARVYVCVCVCVCVLVQGVYFCATSPALFSNI